MQYIGIYQQQKNNNFKSVLLLLAFPLLVLACVWAFFIYAYPDNLDFALQQFVNIVPVVLIVVAFWFTIAYFANTLMIQYATKSDTLSRKENMRVYNLVENLCISQGMQMPKINVIETDALNAFASGINKKTYTVTLTRGIINKLNDEELREISRKLDSPYHSFEQNVKFIAEKTNTKQVCVTKGEFGAVLYYKGKFYYNSGYFIKVMDTVGAGDSFLASLIIRLSRGKSPQKSLNYACAIGALVAASEGANPQILDKHVKTFMNI